MNTLPFAQPSDAVLRRAPLPLPAAPAHGRAPRRSGAVRRRRRRSSSFDCVFSDPATATDGGPRAGGHLHDAGGRHGLVPRRTTSRAGPGTASASSPARAGIRSSWTPRAALKTIATGKLAFTDPGSIYLDGKNVLSLVVEIDCARCWAASSWSGVVAETLTRGKFNVRIERVGRPEVKNMMLAPKQFDQVNRDLEIRDLYNMEDAFHLGEAYPGAYRARLNANLAFWDGLDGKTDWPLGRATATTR